MTVAEPTAADRVLLEQVLRETAVDRSPGRLGVEDYLFVVTRFVSERLEQMLRPLSNLFGDRAASLLWATEVFLFAVLVLLSAVLIRWVWSRYLVRRQGPSVAIAPVSLGPPPEMRALDSTAWAREMELHLKAGDVRRALEAVWWWLARSLCGGNADPSWTSRELLDRAGRPDLRPLAASFDRLAYGPLTPGTGDVRDLVARLRSVLQ